MNKEKTTLKQICDELSDGLHKAPVFTTNGEYLFVNATNLENGYIVDKEPEKHADFNEYKKYGIPLNERTILYSIDGTIGNIAKYRNEKCILGKGACYLKIKNTVDVDYIYYLLQSDAFKGYIKAMSTGSTIHHISLETMRKFSFFLPEVGQQRAVGKTLSLIDAKINTNNSIAQELESMAKTLYDYWFVQFDFPDENGSPYRTSGGEMVWNDQLKREIPKGWAVGRIDQLGSIISGGTPNTKHDEYYCSQGFAWITPNDLSGNTNKLFIGHGERDITQAGIDNSSATLMPKGSVLLSTRAPIGYLAIAQNEVCTNQGFKSIVPNSGYSEYYIYYLLKRNIPALEQLGTGTTFKEVSKDTLAGFTFLLPPKKLTNSFAAKIKSGCELRCRLEEENRELTKLRDWLLPMLMNGQATVE